MIFCHTHRSVPCSLEKLPHAADENKYRDPQPDIAQRVRDLGTLGQRQDVITPLPTKLTEPEHACLLLHP